MPYELKKGYGKPRNSKAGPCPNAGTVCKGEMMNAEEFASPEYEGLKAELDALKGGMALLETRLDIIQRLVVYLLRQNWQLSNEQPIVDYINLLALRAPRKKTEEGHG